ncbi:hypothetical protein [Bacillus mojavensis]
MNKYDIRYSVAFKNSNLHLSNCTATIEGETFDGAVEEFKKKNLEEGVIPFCIMKDYLSGLKFYCTVCNKAVNKPSEHEEVCECEFRNYHV